MFYFIGGTLVLTFNVFWYEVATGTAVLTAIGVAA